jgi:hypothetical protein
VPEQSYRPKHAALLSIAEYHGKYKLPLLYLRITGNIKLKISALMGENCLPHKPLTTTTLPSIEKKNS